MALLGLWHRLAATVPIGPLAREPPCATSAALKRQKTKKKKKKVDPIKFTLHIAYILESKALSKVRCL